MSRASSPDRKYAGMTLFGERADTSPPVEKDGCWVWSFRWSRYGIWCLSVATMSWRGERELRGRRQVAHLARLAVPDVQCRGARLQQVAASDAAPNLSEPTG
jgi:hypothetical protein